MRETVLCAAMLRWLMETFSTIDSSKKVTGTTNSLRFRFLDFQNTLWQKISNWAFRMSVSHSPPHLCSHSACMPSITSHHTHHCECVCVRITSYLQKSNYPKVKLAAEPHCAAHHCKMPAPGCQYWHKRKVEWSYDIIGSLLSPRLLAFIWGRSLRRGWSSGPPWQRASLTE